MQHGLFPIGIYVLNKDSMGGSYNSFVPENVRGTDVFIDPKPILLPYGEHSSKIAKANMSYEGGLLGNLKRCAKNHNYSNDDMGLYFFKPKTAPEWGLFYRLENSSLVLLPAIDAEYKDIFLRRMLMCIRYIEDYNFFQEFVEDYHTKFNELWKFYNEKVKERDEQQKQSSQPETTVGNVEKVDHTPVTEATVPDTTVKRVEQIARSDNSTSLRNE